MGVLKFNAWHLRQVIPNRFACDRKMISDLQYFWIVADQQTSIAPHIRFPRIHKLFRLFEKRRATAICDDWMMAPLQE